MGLIKKAFELTNKNFGLLCLLMAFSLATTLYLSVFKTITSQVIVLYTLILIAFFSGFFNIIKNKAENNSAKASFVEGVGDYFLPMLGIGLISTIAYVVSAVSTMLLAVNIIGTKEQINAALNDILTAMQANSPSAFTSLAPETVKIYLTIILSVWIVWGILSFIIIYWVPTLYIDNERNIFKSLITSIKTLAKIFTKTLSIFIGLILITILTSVISVITSAIAPALEFIFFTLTYYFALVFLFAMFLLYKEAKN